MTGLSRRGFSLGIPALAAAGASLSSVGLAQAPAAAGRSVDQPPLAQLRIGRFKVTALSDGYVDMPYEYFPGRSAAEVEALAKAQFSARAGGVRMMFNQYLIEDGSSRILIDAGPGGTIGHSGRLPAGLSALGLDRGRIDAVIVTHMHQDHIGGLVAGEQANFSKAEIYVDRRELAHWSNPATRSASPAYLQNGIKLAGEVTRLYPKLQAIDGEREIVPGVSIVDLAGHTPGHIGVRIADTGQSLIMAGDMLFPVVHPAGLDVNFLFEQDRPAAQAMRTRFFQRAAAEGALIAATHMPFPGLGRVVADQGQYRWLPAAWAFQD
ncbi:MULTISPECIES: MBL fold metallo-hydrolase [unclassified Bosea (in: a-proteobacteria)]|uniref:MBL fold metallo-hydrolase n=1 Tax=unclassified Bosea (in: a-proteobacteria) TaxID=2653178 RepID=UPI000F755F32|nr:MULTISPECIES: MBL fold metallo-hydrolase [unclassified Bosea (in: a-proteobacteria)]AZO78631.1 MBL fold metallo-hydrolase [Bosea sp. Tri-49]RXT17582.1 MBL fold metallo-hydrolase [Bosea sp. Tri-39]RXT40954.1 MBL fold metallo-hydrolase [Bosea sp. Tri-54]